MSQTITKFPKQHYADHVARISKQLEGYRDLNDFLANRDKTDMLRGSNNHSKCGTQSAIDALKTCDDHIRRSK